MGIAEARGRLHRHLQPIAFRGISALCYHQTVQRAAISGRRIQVTVFPDYRKRCAVPWLRQVATQALIAGQARLPRPRYRSLSLTIADDETVRRLNRDYRGLDETTDVLSFAFDYPGEFQGEGPAPEVGAASAPFITAGEGEDDFAGEVIVSYPQCRRQAEAQGHPVEHELALLIVHGVMHLLGCDHAEAAEERAMQDIERRALAALGIPDPRLATASTVPSNG